jgi:hypothetical protein
MAEKEMKKKQARVERRLKRRAEKRDLICLEVRANDGAYSNLRGTARNRMRMQAERMEIQKVRIAKKRETRQRFAAMKPKDRAKARQLGQKQFHSNPVLTTE